MIQNFVRIGGRETMKSVPFLFSHIQTDGSYKKNLARTAVLLKTSDELSTIKKVTPIIAESSTETEWASVYHGVLFGLEHSETVLALENDDFGVIAALITNNTLKHDYAKYYRSNIVKLVGNTAWTGVRWIPRENNKADALFQKKLA